MQRVPPEMRLLELGEKGKNEEEEEEELLWLSSMLLLSLLVVVVHISLFTLSSSEACS